MISSHISYVVETWMSCVLTYKTDGLQWRRSHGCAEEGTQGRRGIGWPFF